MASDREADGAYNERTVRHTTFASLSLAVVLVATAAACRRAEQPPPAFRVRLLTSQPTSGRWERAAEQGLGRIGAELDADVSRLRADDEAERRELLLAAATAGVDLLFCVGPGFDRIVYLEAAAFPDSSFVMFWQRATAANVASIEFLPQGAGYVAGVVAAHLADADAVAVLRGTGSTWLEPLEDGFLSGFRSVRRDATELALAPPAGPREAIDGGARVALYACDWPQPELLDEARESGLLLIASDVSLLESAPDVVAAAVVVDVPEAMVRIAREVRDGSFRGGPYLFDLGSGVLDVRLGPSLAEHGGAALREALAVARSEVTAGIVEVERLGM